MVITWEAAKPQTDPTLGIAVPAPPARSAANRLVTVGDSLTQGFQSLAISKTDLSWPALLAEAVGLSGNDFRYPTYEGHGGLPFNLEVCVRGLQAKFGRLNLGKDPLAVLWLLAFAHELKHWWMHEADRSWNPPPGLNHNLAVYSYDLQTACTRTVEQIEATIAKPPHGFFHPLVPNDVDRAARRVLAHAERSMYPPRCGDRALGRQGGIETLVVALGSNNVLDVVIGLSYQWSFDEATRAHGRIWSPNLFATDWEQLMELVRQVDADHVILATVPHVTIVPLCAAAGNRLRVDSRYFEHYTHYWLRDDFDPDRDPHLTGDQARAIDSAIDQYNGVIVASVEQARRSGLDWYVFEMSGLLDRLAWRRYLNQPEARPSWWDEAGGAYPLPGPMSQLAPAPGHEVLRSRHERAHVRRAHRARRGPPDDDRLRPGGRRGGEDHEGRGSRVGQRRRLRPPRPAGHPRRPATRDAQRGPSYRGLAERAHRRREGAPAPAAPGEQATALNPSQREGGPQRDRREDDRGEDPVPESRAVLLVMDFQHGIVERIGETSVVDAASRAIEAARSTRSGGHVRPGRLPPGFPEVAEANAGFSAVARTGDAMTEHHPATQVHTALEPRPDEPIIVKRRVEHAFSGSDLDVLLRSAGAGELVLAGLATGGVVLSTIRQAADLDYRLTVLSDACADPDPEIHRVLIEKVFPRQARVTTTDEWIATL